MTLSVRLYPPLNTAAGQDRVSLTLPAGATIRDVLAELADQYGPAFRRHLYDTEDRVVPAWCVFVNGRPLQLNRSENLTIVVSDGDVLELLLNIAGGQERR